VQLAGSVEVENDLEGFIGAVEVDLVDFRLVLVTKSQQLLVGFDFADLAEAAVGKA